MSERGLRRSLVGAAGAVVLLVGLAAMAQSPALSQKASEAAGMLTAAQRDGHVRVIVMFDPPVPPDQIRADPQSIANVTARVAAAQNAIIAAHFGSATNPAPGQGFDRGLTRFPITPGFAVNVSVGELEALAADARVMRLGLDRAVPPAGGSSILAPPAASGTSGSGAKPER